MLAGGVTYDDGAAIVDVGRHQVEHPLDLAFEHARGADAAGSLNNQSHRETLRRGGSAEGWRRVQPAK